MLNTDFRVTHSANIYAKHWAGARKKVMKGALCLFATDADTKLKLHSAADIQRSEADDQVLAFCFLLAEGASWRESNPCLRFQIHYIQKSIQTQSAGHQVYYHQASWSQAGQSNRKTYRLETDSYPSCKT